MDAVAANRYRIGLSVQVNQQQLEQIDRRTSHFLYYFLFNTMAEDPAFPLNALGPMNMPLKYHMPAALPILIIIFHPKPAEIHVVYKAETVHPHKNIFVHKILLRWLLQTPLPIFTATRRRLHILQ